MNVYLMTREELGRALSPEELDKNTRDIEDAFKNVGDNMKLCLTKTYILKLIDNEGDIQ